MINFINEFKEFVNGFFNEISDKRAKDIIYKRFGIGYPKIYTLDEIGILNKGITRERVRQIEFQTIKKKKCYYKVRRLKK